MNAYKGGTFKVVEVCAEANGYRLEGGWLWAFTDEMLEPVEGGNIMTGAELFDRIVKGEIENGTIIKQRSAISYSKEFMLKFENNVLYDLCENGTTGAEITVSELIDDLFSYEIIDDKEPKQMLDFGSAIQLVKEGKRLQRSGWNGKGQFIELATNVSYKNVDDEIINADHDAMGNKAITFVGTSGIQLGWLASQADMLAEDWKIVE